MDYREHDLVKHRMRMRHYFWDYDHHQDQKNDFLYSRIMWAYQRYFFEQRERDIEDVRFQLQLRREEENLLACSALRYVPSAPTEERRAEESGALMLHEAELAFCREDEQSWWW